MKRTTTRATTVLAVASLLVWGCGGDDDAGGEAQEELADALLAEEVTGADEACLRDKTAELSDDDAEFLLDNIDATDTSGFSDELVAWVDSLIDCFELE